MLENKTLLLNYLIRNSKVKGECLIWNGKTDVDRGYGMSYGVMMIDHKNYKTHRLMAFAIGKIESINSKEIVRHSCDNPPCFDPSHILTGTQTQNMQDKIERGRDFNKNKTHCLKGHELTGFNLHVYKGHRRCRACDRDRKSLRKKL